MNDFSSITFEIIMYISKRNENLEFHYLVA